MIGCGKPQVAGDRHSRLKGHLQWLPSIRATLSWSCCCQAPAVAPEDVLGRLREGRV